MKHIITLLICAGLAVGQGVYTGQFRTHGHLSLDTARTFAVDAATDAYIPRWQQLQAKTLNKVVLRVSAVAGTLGANDLVAELLKVVSPAGALINSVTYTDASDTVIFTAHPFTNGDMVRFGAATSLPAGITANTTYYVCNSAANTFQIDNDSGCGSVVTDFSGSSGTQTVRWLVGETNTVTAAPTGAQNVEFTGFNTALAAGTSYGIAARNVNANPGTNYPTFSTVGSISMSAGPGFNSVVANTTTGFSTIGLVGSHSTLNLRLEFSDGSFLGATTDGAAATESVYGTAAAGTRVPALAGAVNVIGVCMSLSITGTPASEYEFRIYTGADSSETLLATTNSFSRRLTGPTCSLFSAAVTIPTNTAFRVIAAPVTNVDSSGNRLNVPYLPIPNTAADKALYGGLQKATCAIPCTAGGWTYTDTNVPMSYSLILSDGAEFPAASAVSGGSYPYVQ